MDRSGNLLDIFAEANLETPPDLASALGALPAAGALPLPWTTWTMINLVHYGERKRWALEILETHVAPTLARRRGRDVDMKDVVARGIVPHLPEWGFSLHGGTGILVRGRTGQPIRVDLRKGADVFDRFEFVEYIWAHRLPSQAARRLVALHPSYNALDLALDEMREVGLLHRIGAGNSEELGRPVQILDRPVEDFLRAWRDHDRRLWLAAMIGDWLAAKEAALAGGDRGLIALTGERAARCLELRVHQIRERILETGLDEAHLHALSDAGAGDLPVYLQRAIEQSDEASIAALDLRGDGSDHVPQVYALFQQAGRDPHSSHLLTPIAGYLARQGYRPREMLDRLAKTSDRDLGPAAVLALEHFPEVALTLLRRTLRCDHHTQRITAAAALALVDKPWSRRELRAVLDESDDQDATVECRAALRESRDPEARRTADRWEKSHPGWDRPSTEPIRYRHRSVMDSERALAREMDRLRDRPVDLRDLAYEPI